MFDPRVSVAKGLNPDDIRRVWCAENIEIAKRAIANGEPLVASPFFNNDPRLRKAGLVYDWSEEELKEAARCAADILYFADKFVQMLRPDNTYGPIVLRPYQRAYLRLCQTNRFIAFLAARQVGKTTTTAIFLLWLMLFHTDMKIALLGDKLPTACENLQKLKDIYSRLPFFLQAGIVGWNQHAVAFDNGSSIFAAPCTLSSIVGRTISVLYFDEMAIPNDSDVRPTWEFAFPTISALQNSRVICTSSPRGDGVFREICEGAPDNGFAFFKVEWYEVPGRDEAWHQQQLKILGERGFDQQYGNKFLSEGTGWIDDATAERFAENRKKARWQRFIDVVEDSDKLKILRSVEAAVLRTKYVDKSTMTPLLHLIDMLMIDTNLVSIEDLKNKPFVITDDASEGRGNDFHVMHFWLPDFGDDQQQILDEAQAEQEALDMMQQQAFENGEDFASDDSLYDDIDINSVDGEFVLNNSCRWRQALTISSNQHCEPMFALFLQLLLRYYFDLDKLRIVCELDGCGAKMQKYLVTDIVKNSSLDTDVFPIGIKGAPGIYQRGRQKLANIQATESAMANGNIEVSYPATIFEIGKFQEVKAGKFMGVGAHDDQVMPIVDLGAWLQLEDASNFIENCFDSADDDNDVDLEDLPI